MMRYGYFVLKRGNNIIVDNEVIKRFMRQFFEMERVHKSGFYMNGYYYEIYSYNSTEDIKLVRVDIDKCVIINSFNDFAQEFKSDRYSEIMEGLEEGYRVLI